MPKRIDYSDRVEGIREVAYEIAVEHGISAISLAAVAERLVMSPRTIQRLLASSTALPMLAAQRAARLERNRQMQRARRPSWMSAPVSQRGLTMLLEKLPGHPERADRDVWWQLVLAHAGADWAAAARTSYDDEVAASATDVLSGIADEDVRAREVVGLHALVVGAASLICHGRATYAQVEEIVHCHVAQVLAEHGVDEDAA